MAPPSAFVAGLAPAASSFLGARVAAADVQVRRPVAAGARMLASGGTPTKFDRMRQKWGAPAVDESKGGMYVWLPACAWVVCICVVHGLL